MQKHSLMLISVQLWLVYGNCHYSFFRLYVVLCCYLHISLVASTVCRRPVYNSIFLDCRRPVCMFKFCPTPWIWNVGAVTKKSQFAEAMLWKNVAKITSHRNNIFMFLLKICWTCVVMNLQFQHRKSSGIVVSLKSKHYISPRTGWEISLLFSDMIVWQMSSSQCGQSYVAVVCTCHHCSEDRLLWVQGTVFFLSMWHLFTELAALQLYNFY